MNNNGTLSLNRNDGNIWDIILDNGEITLCSNGYYLSIEDDKEKVVGNKMMKIGNFKKYENKYEIIFENKYLTIINGVIKFKKCKINEKFSFLDCFIDL